VTRYWSPNKKLPIKRSHEIAPEGDAEHAFRAVLDEIRSAHELGIPFSVRTVYSQSFRFGGNVNKADIFSYEVTVGELDDRTKS